MKVTHVRDGSEDNYGCIIEPVISMHDWYIISTGFLRGQYRRDFRTLPPAKKRRYIFQMNRKLEKLSNRQAFECLPVCMGVARVPQDGSSTIGGLTPGKTSAVYIMQPFDPAAVAMY